MTLFGLSHTFKNLNHSTPLESVEFENHYIIQVFEK